MLEHDHPRAQPKPPPWPYCTCPNPIPMQRAERKGAGRSHCARCEKELPIRLWPK